MARRFFVTIVVGCCLWAGGCTEDQRVKIDEAADAVQQSAPTAEALVNSPAGDMLGDKGQDIALIGLTALSALAGAWQTLRKEQLRTTGKVIVRAVESLGDKEKENVKNTIAKSAQIADAESTVRKTVKKLKAG